MFTTEIPKSTWNDFTEHFSRNHNGWMVDLDVFDLNIGAQRQVENWPLSGVTYEHNSDRPRLIVSTRDRKGNHLNHPIVEPRKMWLEKRDDGSDVALAVESETGRQTILRFRNALLPDMLDPAVE